MKCLFNFSSPFLSASNLSFKSKAFKASMSLARNFTTEGIEEVQLTAGNHPGSLRSVLDVFEENQVSLTYIESKLKNRIGQNQEVVFHCAFKGNREDQVTKTLERNLTEKFGNVTFKEEEIVVPWFPRTSSDLNLIGDELIPLEEEANKDSPQFTDDQYRRRRDFIANLSRNHKFGQPIPYLDYTEQENDTWRQVYKRLKQVHNGFCSAIYLENQSKLEKVLDISARIPQLKDLDAYLKEKTNFRLKPAQGIVSQRQFLNALAHRVYFSTQYIRHHETIDYSPEPDIVHEIVGHIPMFADPVIADISQQIGLLSLGASDEELRKLGNLYYFTMEFGLCKEGGELKPFGAGILGSVAECLHVQSNKPRFERLDPFKASQQNYPLQDLQPLFYYTDTIEECFEQIIRFGDELRKPMRTWYNYKTNMVECDRKVVAKLY